MMTRFLIAVSLLFIFDASSFALSPDNFRYYAELSGPIKENTLYRGHITYDILQKAASGITDVRLFDDRSREIPYVIVDGIEAGQKVEEFPLEIIDYLEGNGFAVVTMKMPEKYKPISIIDFNIPDRDFKKEFELYGSYDAARWETVSKGFLYDFSSQVNLRKTRLQFKKADYRYYKIKFTSSVPHGNQKAIRFRYEGLEFSTDSVTDKKVRILGITGLTDTRSEGSISYDSKSFSDFKVTLDKAGNSVIDMEANLPVDIINFNMENPYYYRVVKIYVSDTGKEDSYNYIHQGELYNFPLSGLYETKTHMEIKASKHRFYRFVVVNRNSPALSITGITFKWVSKYLLFVSLENNSKYTFRFGGIEISRPEYDLTRFVNQGNWRLQRYEEIGISAAGVNPNYRTSLSGDIRVQIEKIILTATVILLVAALSYWLYHLIRKVPPNKGK